MHHVAVTHLVLGLATNVDFGTNFEDFLLAMAKLRSINGDLRLAIDVLRNKTAL